MAPLFDPVQQDDHFVFAVDFHHSFHAGQVPVPRHLLSDMGLFAVGCLGLCLRKAGGPKAGPGWPCCGCGREGALGWRLEVC